MNHARNCNVSQKFKSVSFSGRYTGSLSTLLNSFNALWTNHRAVSMVNSDIVTFNYLRRQQARVAAAEQVMYI